MLGQYISVLIVVWVFLALPGAEILKAQLKQADNLCKGVVISLGDGGVECHIPGAGISFQDCKDCPEMVVVPAGHFLMGASAGEKGSDKSEEPQHEVKIAQPFAAGRFEVSWNEWDICVREGGCNNAPVEKAGGDHGWGKGDRPVIEVSWNDAQAYVRWLSSKTGKKYRLLTETEWEYVARAGTTGPFSFSGEITMEKANYNGRYNSLGNPKDKDKRKTVPVKSFSPNPWGLYQVHGNVWEWVEDCYSNDYKNAPADGSAAEVTFPCTRVLRGGSWYFGWKWLRSAVRLADSPTGRHNNIGFRIARTLAD